MDVYSLRNRTVLVGVWVRYSSTDDLIPNVDSTSQYQDRDGYIETEDRVTPSSNSAFFTGDFLLPVDIFPSGNYHFYPEVEVQVNGNVIGEVFGTDCTISHTTNTPTDLNPLLDPTFGSVSLRASFTPDPYRAAIITGGSVNVDDFLTGDCVGYAAEAPDFNIRLTSSLRYIRFYFDSSEDTTMVINDPNGDWYCDDNSGPGSDPQIAFSRPVAGTYNVWIGDYEQGNATTGYLYLSEYSS